MSDIYNLECSNVLHFFEEISKIPRSSGNEKQISDYLVDFAKKRKLWVYQDDSFNVVIKKKGTEGYENSQPIILQGHIDMVCEKNKDIIHDFEKDPIKIIYDGDFIKADGTTLGGDNGIAVAMMLALLDSENIVHPNLEAVFTSDEEVGMHGAQALDGNVLDGKILLNIDSEEEGIFTVGCAGGMRASVMIPIIYENQPENLNTYSLFINGLRGGHSGIDIAKQRANSNILIARVLNSILNECEIKLNSISGGAKDNAIPREAEAIISFKESDFNKVNEVIEKLEETIKGEYRNTDGNIKIKIKKCENIEKCFSKDSMIKVISVMMLIPNGVLTMSTDIEGLPESSNNLGIVRTNENNVELTCAVRSAVVSRKYLIFEQIKLISELAGGSASYKGDYPAWEYKPDSFIRNLLVDTYKEKFNTEPVLETIHAGLECGLFAKKKIDIDMISFGPNLYDIHTPDERASISSIDRTWSFLLDCLKKLK